jgi:aryl-alcohol dehydrogenase-like predicted oxidoreductase
MMDKRRLGRSELQVPLLCIGGNVFGWTADEATSHALLDAFFEAGLSFIDTADSYSRWVAGHRGGESETIIGNWMRARGNRDAMIVATKVGSEMGPGRKGLSKAYIRTAVEDSLRRLQTDRIDLYQSHWDDPETPFEETLEAYADLVRAGKVRVIGASNLTADRMREALDTSARTGLPRYESLQPLYNLYDREPYEGALEQVCRENEIGVIGYFSLAAGFLTGKYRSRDDLGQSPRGSRVEKYLDDRGFRILSALDRVADQHRATPPQVALAWLMARPGLTAPIASATNIEQAKDLIAATRLRLEASAVDLLTQASAPDSSGATPEG